MSTADNLQPMSPGSEHSPLRFFPQDRHPFTLSPADAAALDSLLDPAQADPSAPALDAARRQRVSQWLAILGTSRAAAPPADLLARTLQAVQDDATSLQAIRARRDQEMQTTGWQISRRLGEFAAMGIAATLLLAVLIPGLGSARQNAKRAACAGTVASIGEAMDTYAAQNHDALPSIPPSPDGNWMPRDVSLAGASVSRAGHSNAANLLPLLRLGMISGDKLVCPGRGSAVVQLRPDMPDIPDQARGYSYANLFGSVRPTWDRQATTIVLADRNPLFTPAAPHDPFENSLNHGRRGTNVLAADRSVRWVIHPNIGPAGDNMWTISNGQVYQTTYQGTETPANFQDIFLAP